jgi:hypothetical protein
MKRFITLLENVNKSQTSAGNLSLSATLSSADIGPAFAMIQPMSAECRRATWVRTGA